MKLIFNILKIGVSIEGGKCEAKKSIKKAQGCSTVGLVGLFN
jgi:hypothetical protein